MSSLNVEKVWLGLDLPTSILKSHPDCVDYLVNSKIVYPLAGYANSTDEPGGLGIRLEKEDLFLKIEGCWRRWEEVKDLLNEREWNYTSLEGLVLKNRLHYPEIYPVHSLSKEQYEKVQVVAKRFFERNPERDLREEKDCVLQFMTTSLRGSSPFSLEHCTIRLIRPVKDQIEVYSFGSEMTEEQYRYTMPNGPSASWISRSILTTVETKIGMGDFMEFREAKLRRITSIPLSSDQANRVLRRVNHLSQERLRFNYIGQNCLALAHEVMEEAGYEMPDIHMSLGQLVASTGLDRNRYPLIARILSHENRITMVISNLVAVALGGLRMSTPQTDQAAEEPLGRSAGIHKFSRLVRSSWSLLTENCSRINYHSLPFIEWQLKQPSTVIIIPTMGRPKMYGI